MKLTILKFIQRTRVISFYRTILRGTKHIADAQTKAESRRYARDEFERHRNVTDLVCGADSPFHLNYAPRITNMSQSHIRYLLSTGKTEWEGMERYVGGM